jgi:hypothetical protein
MVAVFVITLIVFALVVGILLWVKTPRYQMQSADVILLLKSVLVGQASENDWTIFLASSFRHSPELEIVRERCAQIDESEYLGHSRTGFLFSQEGLWQLKQILDELESRERQVIG